MDGLKGVGVALVTPFNANGEIDYIAFKRLIAHVMDGKVDFLVVQGTTGESATISTVDKQHILSFVVHQVNRRLPIVYGYGGNNTAALIAGYDRLDLTGVSAILSVSPYYNKPSQAGIIAHYRALSNAFDLPIILYNVPGRTGSNITADSTLKIAEFENVLGIKEASGDLAQMSYIIKNRPDGFMVWSGDDDLILYQMALGADGAISVIANALPTEFSDIVHSALRVIF